MSKKRETKQTTRLKKEIREKLKIPLEKEIRFYAQSMPGNNVKIEVHIGKIIVESMIEADFYDEHFKTEKTFFVIADNDTGALIEVIT